MSSAKRTDLLELTEDALLEVDLLLNVLERHEAAIGGLAPSAPTRVLHVNKRSLSDLVVAASLLV